MILVGFGVADSAIIEEDKGNHNQLNKQVKILAISYKRKGNFSMIIYLFLCCLQLANPFPNSIYITSKMVKRL